MEPIAILLDLLPTALAVLAVAGALWGAGRLFDRWEGSGRARRFSRQLSMLGLSVAGLVVIVLALPIDPGEKGNLHELLAHPLRVANLRCILEHHGHQAADNLLPALVESAQSLPELIAIHAGAHLRTARRE